MKNIQIQIKTRVPWLIVAVNVILSILISTTNTGNDIFQSLPGTVQNELASMNESFAPPNLLSVKDSSNSAHSSSHHNMLYTLRHLNNLKNGNLLFNYVREPAPMGIVDYGLSTTAGPGLFNTYSYSTAKFLGIISINTLLTQGNKTVGNSMSIQLNSMLVFNDSHRQYSYWIQNIAVLNTSSRCIFYEDNIWNSSWPLSRMYDSTVSGKGEIVGANSYYGYATPTSSSSETVLDFPAIISMEVVSFEAQAGQPAVSFMYNEGSGWQIYDTVIFKFAHTTSDRGFVVNGNGETLANADLDAEFVLGGPGNGYTTKDVFSNVSLQLDFWNGNNFQMVQNAFDFGSDTAETISNVSVSLGHLTESGTLFFTISGGGGPLHEVYTYLNISTLTVLSPFPAGKLTIGNQVLNFTGGKLNLTIYPGTYSIELNVERNDHWTYWNTITILSAGKTTTLLVPLQSINYLIVEKVFVGLVVMAVTLAAGLAVRRRRISMVRISVGEVLLEL